MKCIVFLFIQSLTSSIYITDQIHFKFYVINTKIYYLCWSEHLLTVSGTIYMVIR